MLTVQKHNKDVYVDIFEAMKNTFENVDCMLDSKIQDNTSTGTPTGKDMIEKINQCGFCSWMGHGEPSTIACSGRDSLSNEWQFIKALSIYKTKKESPENYQSQINNSIDNNGLDELTNFDRPSVVYTNSCATTPFDIYENKPVYNIPLTLSSSFTVGGLYGGVGYLGNTRVGYTYYSPALEVAFFAEIIKNPNIGIAEALSKNEYIGNSKWHLHTRHANNLIGDPEFKMWRCKPATRSVIVSWNDKDIFINGYDVVGSTVVINNGEGHVRRQVVKQMESVKYSKMGKMEAVGVYKTGYLPLVKLDCFDDQLEDCNKKFVVRQASLGCDELKTVSIGRGASVDVRAVDSIEGGTGLDISDSGSLTLRCDKSVSLDGTKVSSGGNLSVKGEKVVLSNGFAVKAGGSLSINNN